MSAARVGFGFQTGVLTVLEEFRRAAPPLILDSGKRLWWHLIHVFTCSFRISFEQRRNRFLCPGRTKPPTEYTDLPLRPVASAPGPQAAPGALAVCFANMNPGCTTKWSRESGWARAGDREATLALTLFPYQELEIVGSTCVVVDAVGYITSIQ